MTLVVTPSKLNLLRDAKPLEDIQRWQGITTLVVDQSILALANEAIVKRSLSVPPHMTVEFADNGTMVIMGLGGDNCFIRSFRDDSWPHIHVCPRCGDYIRCECFLPEMDFDDAIARCAKCKKT